jgi:hypothetical protein
MFAANWIAVSEYEEISGFRVKSWSTHLREK